MMLTTNLLSYLCVHGCLLNNDWQAMSAVVLGLDCKVCEVLDPAVELTDALMPCADISLQRAGPYSEEMQDLGYVHISACKGQNPTVRRCRI